MNVLGLDIGTSHIKAVSLEKDKNKRLQRYAVVPSRGMAKKIMSESKQDVEELATYVKEFLLENSFIAHQVVAVLPDYKIFSKVISIPTLSGKELQKAIEWEAEQHLPRPLSEVYLKYTVIEDESESQKKKSSKILSSITGKSGKNDAGGIMEVLLVAAPKNVVDRYLTMLNKSGVEPIGLEPCSLSTIRSTTSQDISVPTIVINFGYRNIDFYLSVGNVLRFVRTINFALSSILRIISQDLDISPVQANEYLYTYGMKEDELGGKIRETMLPVTEIIVDEFKKSRYFVENRSNLMGGKGHNKVKRVILSGGGASIPGMMVYLAQETSLEIEYANPWEAVDVSGVENKEELELVGPLFAASVGAALKGI